MLTKDLNLYQIMQTVPQIMIKVALMLKKVVKKNLSQRYNLNYINKLKKPHSIFIISNTDVWGY